MTMVRSVYVSFTAWLKWMIAKGYLVERPKGYPLSSVLWNSKQKRWVNVDKKSVFKLSELQTKIKRVLANNFIMKSLPFIDWITACQFAKV